MIPQQPDDICQRPDCGRIRISARHEPCFVDMLCVCDGKRDHELCHDFKEATK
jgi:hypothetical protein